LVYAQKCKRLVQEYQQISARADAEGRDLTRAEQLEVQRLVEEAKTAKSVADFSRSLGPSSDFTGGAGPGDVFIRSQGYKMVWAAELRGNASWTSGPVEVGSVPGYQLKGTRFETTAPAGGAALVQADVRGCR